MEWEEYRPSNRPPEAGYYLITWVDISNPYRGGKRQVSEAWYNQDAIVPWWWTRRYTGENYTGLQMAVRFEVLAWMKMPKPYREIIQERKD